MRIARMLALGGLAVAGWKYFDRRRSEQNGEAADPVRDEPTSSRDPVDEAIAESFPASDPPSYAGSTSSADEEPR